MGKTSFSRHMTMDRADRYATIATKVGFGEVLYTSTYSDRDGRWQNRTVQLTSTGVCIVKSESGTVVTMYCVTLALAKSYFKLEKMPRDLLAAIRLNERKGYCNLQLQFPNVVVGCTTISFLIIFEKGIDLPSRLWYNINVNKREPNYSHK